MRGNRLLLRFVASTVTETTRDIADNAVLLPRRVVAADDTGLFAGGAEQAPDDWRVSRFPMRVP